MNVFEILGFVGTAVVAAAIAVEVISERVSLFAVRPETWIGTRKVTRWLRLRSSWEDLQFIGLPS